MAIKVGDKFLYIISLLLVSLLVNDATHCRQVVLSHVGGSHLGYRFGCRVRRGSRRTSGRAGDRLLGVDAYMRSAKVQPRAQLMVSLTLPVSTNLKFQSHANNNYPAATGSSELIPKITVKVALAISVIQLIVRSLCMHALDAEVLYMLEGGDCVYASTSNVM